MYIAKTVFSPYILSMKWNLPLSVSTSRIPLPFAVFPNVWQVLEELKISFPKPITRILLCKTLSCFDIVFYLAFLSPYLLLMIVISWSLLHLYGGVRHVLSLESNFCHHLGGSSVPTRRILPILPLLRTFTTSVSNTCIFYSIIIPFPWPGVRLYCLELFSLWNLYIYKAITC